jgi:hypothetical protein
MAHPQVPDGEESLHVRTVAVNILNKQSHTADKGWSSSYGVGWGLTTPHHKKICMLHRTSDLDRFFGRTKAMENGHEIWNLKCQEAL